MDVMCKTHNTQVKLPMNNTAVIALRISKEDEIPSINTREIIMFDAKFISYFRSIWAISRKFDISCMSIDKRYQSNFNEKKGDIYG